MPTAGSGACAAWRAAARAGLLGSQRGHRETDRLVQEPVQSKQRTSARLDSVSRSVNLDACRSKSGCWTVRARRAALRSLRRRWIPHRRRISPVCSRHSATRSGYGCSPASPPPRAGRSAFATSPAATSTSRGHHLAPPQGSPRSRAHRWRASWYLGLLPARTCRLAPACCPAGHARSRRRLVPRRHEQTRQVKVLNANWLAKPDGSAEFVRGAS
jgi:hypothetical protein